MSCKCSNKGVLDYFKFCPYCGSEFKNSPERYPYERQQYDGGLQRGDYAVQTGEFRRPMKDEYYLSGSVPMAYKAPNDLSYKYHIAKIIRT